MERDSFYGIQPPDAIEDEARLIAEEVHINGWAKLENVVNGEGVNQLRLLIDEIYRKQEAEFGREVLLQCNEADQARCLTRYDKSFLAIAKIPRLVAITSTLLGDFYTLVLQNSVISRPHCKNHQSSWHRDLPYQNFVSSEPLAINLLLVIDEFTADSGGTEILPFTHKLSKLPSCNYINKHRQQVIAKSGDMLIFDSMLFHRAGYNRSEFIRRTINSQFAKPFISPQYDHLNAVPESFIENEADRRLLGGASTIATDDYHWRLDRISRLKKRL